MKIIKTADWHLTTNPLDEYRWDFIDWLIKYCKKNEIDRVDILGDLTIKKDNHPSKLVNRIIGIISELAEACTYGVYILKGNHDYIDVEHSFFAFADKLNKVKFIQKPFIIDKELFLPHSQDPETEWSKFNFNNFSIINVHQCFIGSMSNGHRMDKGLDHKMFKDFKGTVYAGDIHQRQCIGNILYIGAPYHINFGDSYEGRIISLNNGKEKNIDIESIQKLKFTISSEKEAKKIFADYNGGHQAKVVIRLHQSEMHEWKQLRSIIRERAKKADIILCGITFEKIKDTGVVSIGKQKVLIQKMLPGQVLRAFCENEKLNKQITEVGFEFLERQEV